MSNFQHGRSRWKTSAEQILTTGPVIAVTVVNKLEQAVPLAQALVAGGVKVLEVTLRTPCALEAIRAIIKAVPAAIVGAGTVSHVGQLKQVTDAGAQFAISPGMTAPLLQAAGGGVKMLQAIAAPFPHARFCPTGGISLHNYRDYLALESVPCIGGSWLAPADARESGDYPRITQLAQEAVAGICG